MYNLLTFMSTLITVFLSGTQNNTFWRTLGSKEQWSPLTLLNGKSYRVGATQFSFWCQSHYSVSCHAKCQLIRWYYGYKIVWCMISTGCLIHCVKVFLNSMKWQWRPSIQMQMYGVPLSLNANLWGCQWL